MNVPQLREECRKRSMMKSGTRERPPRPQTQTREASHYARRSYVPPSPLQKIAGVESRILQFAEDNPFIRRLSSPTGRFVVPIKHHPVFGLVSKDGIFGKGIKIRYYGWRQGDIDSFRRSPGPFLFSKALDGYYSRTKKNSMLYFRDEWDSDQDEWDSDEMGERHDEDYHDPKNVSIREDGPGTFIGNKLLLYEALKTDGSVIADPRVPPELVTREAIFTALRHADSMERVFYWSDDGSVSKLLNWFDITFMRKHGLCDDPHMIMLAVQKDGKILRNASMRLRMDRQIAVAAVRNNIRALTFAPLLKNDYNFVLALMSQHPHALLYAGHSLRSNKNIITACWRSILKKDGKFMIANADGDTSNGYMFENYMNPELLRDYTFLQKLLSIADDGSDIGKGMQTALREIVTFLKEHPEIYKFYEKHYKASLRYLNDTILERKWNGDKKGTEKQLFDKIIAPRPE